MKSIRPFAAAAILLATLTGRPTQAALTYWPGQLMREFYLNIDFLSKGNNFGPLDSAPNYPNSPDIREYVFNLNGNQYYDNRLGGGTENYAMRIAGHLLPTVSGSYTFKTFNDDSARLSLSTDQNASNVVTILNIENTCCDSAGYNSTAVQLQVGQAYFFELLLQQGTGGHYLHLQWQPPGSNSFQDIPATNLAYGYSVEIVQQPVSQTVPANTPVTFSTKLRLDGAAAEAGKTQARWQRSGDGGSTWTNLAGATGTSFTLTNTTTQDDQARFRLIVDEPGTGLSLTSSVAGLTVTPDTVPPWVTAAGTRLNNTNIILTFSEPMDPTITQDRLHYTLSGGVTVQSATLDGAGLNLTLVTTPMTPEVIYALNVADIRDRAQPVGNLISPNPTLLNISLPLVVSGSVQREIWTGIATPPNYLAQLFNDPRYPGQPTYLDYIPTPFGSYSTNPTNEQYESYGMRYAGHIIPSTSGLYQFQVHADDSSRFRLSTDVQASNAVQLVIRDGSCCVYDLSPSVYLLAGQPYYFDATMEEGGGLDYLEITWKPPGSSGFSLLPSANVAYIFGLAPGTTPASVTVSNNMPATFTVIPWTYGAAQAEGKVHYQWERFGDGGSTWSSIPGANGQNYTIAQAHQTDNGAQFRVQVSAAGTSLSFTNGPATLSVINVPFAVGLSVLERRSLRVFYSTNMDAATALDASRYHINHGVTVTNAEFEPTVGTNGPQSVVRLDVQPLLGFFPDYSLAISNVLSAANLLPITPNPTVLSFHLDYRNLGYLYLSPLPGAEYVSAQTRYVLVRFKDLPPAAVSNLATFITVNGSSSGIHVGQTHVASDGRTIIFTMNRDFSNNELVTISLAPQSAPGSGLDAYQYQFVVAGHVPDLGIVTARGDNAPYQSKENAFDGDPATKWLDYSVPNGSANFSWIQYVYPSGGTRIIGQYALTSADDAPERDPADWNLYGVDPPSKVPAWQSLGAVTPPPPLRGNSRNSNSSNARAASCANSGWGVRAVRSAI
ncbi:MAG: PA14 domain-containing protein [Verrucomicrobia bacterium]|nr:PA14 domain-containing protein [Verrucomicrobiota bacterium]